MSSLVLPIVITSSWFPLFDTRAEVVPLRDWSPVISTQLMAVSFVEEEVKPNIPDLVPNEDPAKCPCKGTGKITHGDGHQTDCPFHGNQDVTSKGPSPDKCKCDTAETYCNCIKVYGKCSCATRDPSTESQDLGEFPRRNRRSHLFRGGT